MAEKEYEAVKRITDPRLPSQDEVNMHNMMGHIPYRNWCPICVKSQGRDTSHFKSKRDQRLLPEYSWDYCFPGDECG